MIGSQARCDRGPDGHVLVVAQMQSAWWIFDFQTIQTIPWQEDGFPGVPHPSVQFFHILVTPSRHGFAIIDRNHCVSLYGSTLQRDSEHNGIRCFCLVTGGFVTWSGFNPGPAVLHVDVSNGLLPRILNSERFDCCPATIEVLGLTRKFNLYRIDQRGSESLIARLGSLAPGVWNSGFRFDQARPGTNRVLFFSHGLTHRLYRLIGYLAVLQDAVSDWAQAKLCFFSTTVMSVMMFYQP